MLRIQQLNLAPAIGGIDEAYFRGGSAMGEKIIASKGERVSFDSYFNAFSYTKYRSYTRLEQVYSTLEIAGEARVTLCTYDGEKEEIVGEKLCTGGTVTLSARLADLPEIGILYPVVYPLTSIEITGGEYSAELEPDEVSIAIAICTFRRERRF